MIIVICLQRQRHKRKNLNFVQKCWTKSIPPHKRLSLWLDDRNDWLPFRSVLADACSRAVLFAEISFKLTTERLCSEDKYWVGRTVEWEM